jgi:DNA helicase IV
MIDIDCRLSLHTNCRNTKEIAHFANCHISPLQHSQTEMVLKGVVGSKKPHVIFYKNISTIKQFIGQQVAEWQSNNIDISESCKIVSLHSSRDKGGYSSISEDLGIKKGKYKLNTSTGEVKISAISASKIKGLESDYIFITDVNLERYTDEAFLKRMYVASSRAKHELYVFVKFTDDVEVLKSALRVVRATNIDIINNPFHLLEKFVKTLGATFE